MHEDDSSVGLQNPSGIPMDKKNGFQGGLPHTEPQLTWRANGLGAGRTAGDTGPCGARPLLKKVVLREIV